MFNLSIVDAELELVPPTMWDDFQVRKIANSSNKNPRQMLLDSNYMHSAIERHFPGMSNRRGRPDIFHMLLNVVQDSILNKKGMLSVRIHTRNNIIIRIAPETRVPKSYNRFAGLMEKLLVNGKTEAPDGKILMWTEQGKWDSLLMDNCENVLLSPSGERKNIKEICKKKDMNLIIGGFSEGDFLSDVYSALKPVSIFENELTIWTVAWKSIGTVEDLLGF